MNKESLAIFKTEAQQILMLKEALENMMGIYNTPLSRRRFPQDKYMKTAINEAEEALNYYKQQS